MAKTESAITFDYRWFAKRSRWAFETYILPEFGLDSRKPPIRYLEIGVWEGASLHWVLTYLNVRAAVAVDPWLPSKKHAAEEVEAVYERAKGNLEEWTKSGKLYIHRQTSDSFWEICQDTRDFYDLIYIDGDHTYEAVARDAENAWQLLAPGGIIVFDDYCKRHLPFKHVPQAVDEFLESCKGQWEPFYVTGKQMSVRKK